MYGISHCRSKSHPWGLPVFLKHPAIILSNKIIQNTIKLAMWLAKHGVRVSIENPHSSCLWSIPEIHEMVLQVGQSKNLAGQPNLFLEMVLEGLGKHVFTSPSRTRPTGTTPIATIADMACSTGREPASFHASFTSFLCKRVLVS